ncbi:hypothetical protein BDW67DRAFT_186310 [Aspergillus spinulosporus]
MSGNNDRQDFNRQGSSQSPSSHQYQSSAATNTGNSRPWSNYTYSGQRWGDRPNRTRSPPVPLWANSELLYERPPTAMDEIPPSPEPLRVPSRYFEPGPASAQTTGSTTSSTSSAASTPAPRRESRSVLERETSKLSGRRESGNVLRQALDKLGKGEKEDKGKGRDSGNFGHVFAIIFDVYFLLSLELVAVKFDLVPDEAAGLYCIYRSLIPP